MYAHFYVFDSKWFGWSSLQDILITFFVLSESDFAESIGVSCWSSPSMVLKKIRNTIGTRFHVDWIDSIQKQPKVVAEPQRGMTLSTLFYGDDIVL